MGVRVIRTGGTQPPAKPKSAFAATFKPYVPWIVAAAAIFAAVVVVALVWPGGDFGPSPDNGGFVAVGRAYVPSLGSAYADGWEDGAKILDAGQPIPMALDTVAKSFEASRVKAFRERLTPALNQVVPESKADKDVTPEDRAALAKAWRGLARGLRGK